MVATQSLTEQLRERLTTEPVVVVDASLDEYWTVLAEFARMPSLLEYDIEYADGQIIAQIGMASDRHETIVANMASVLRTAYYDMPTVRVMGSNKLIYVPPCELAAKPDVLVMQEESNVFPRKGQEGGITNPYLLVEVHSDSTYQVDMSTKLRCYKQLDSVAYIMYVEQDVPFVSVFAKQQDNRHWLNEDFTSLDMTVQIGDVAIPMRDVYHKALSEAA